MKGAFAAVLLLLVAACGIRAQAPDITETPQPIQELASAIQGKGPDDVRTEIIKRFGSAHREMGSGFRIEQWDLFGGVLTFHPASGPTFVDPGTSKRYRLLRTTNPAGANILESYEMTTLPDAKNHDMKYWLGNVKFGAGGSYRFIDSHQNLDHRAGQNDNFFMLHPTGTVAVRYVPPITADTLLESLPENTVVAHLDFKSNDHKHEATFSITSSERSRTLSFGADKPLSFLMDGWWKNLWR
jgi:hypothetical protein